jgi:hypothetical protein
MNENAHLLTARSVCQVLLGPNVNQAAILPALQQVEGLGGGDVQEGQVSTLPGL